jgi:transposase
MKILPRMVEQKELTKVIDPAIWASIPLPAQQVIAEIFTVQQAQIDRQQEQIKNQQEQIALLSKQIEDLKALINQNSHNSSRPPSTDPPSVKKYPSKSPTSGKSRGGQDAHQGYFRQPPSPEKITNYVDHRPLACDHCDEEMQESVPDAHEIERRYTYELPEPKLIITEHRVHAVRCPKCGQTAYGEVPPEFGGAFGPRLHAAVGFMRSRGISLGETQNFLDQFYGLEIARSSLSEICLRVSHALEKVHLAAEKVIERADIVNTDETGWKEAGQPRYLWVHVSAQAVVYHITEKRNQVVMAALLGVTFIGLVCSDRLGIYNVINPRRRQICLAHLKRNFQGIAEREGEYGAWGKTGVALLEELFSLWHKFKNGHIKRRTLQNNMSHIQSEMKELLYSGSSLETEKIKRMSANLLLHWPALWTFSRVPGVEPTNNVSEQSLRRAVLWRSLSFGSQSEWGCRFVERMLTVSSTCRKQERPVLAYLEQAMLCYFRGEEPPPLFPLAN